MAVQDSAWIMNTNPTFFFVTIGRIAGKVKYTLVTCNDLSFLHQHGFTQIHAVMEVDRNGYGCRIIAMVNNHADPWHPRPLHEIIYERHHGAIDLGYKVGHIDGETMDNRIENLQLIEASQAGLDQQNSSKSSENLSTAYRLAMTELLTAPFSPLPVACRLQEGSHYPGMPGGYAFATISIPDSAVTVGQQLYFECHYPPCTRVEQQMKTYSVCGRCQQTRYCSNECQSLDWIIHQNNCQEAKMSNLDMEACSYSETLAAESLLPENGGPQR